MKPGNFPPAFCPYNLLEEFPKAAIADAAFNFAMQLCEDDPAKAIELFRSEATRSKQESRDQDVFRKKGGGL